MRASIPTLFAIVLALNALPAQQKKHAPKASDKPNILNETEAFSGYYNFNYRIGKLIKAEILLLLF